MVVPGVPVMRSLPSERRRIVQRFRSHLSRVAGAFFSFIISQENRGHKRSYAREKIAEAARTMFQCVEFSGKKGGLSTTTEANWTACGLGAHVEQHHAGIWSRSAQARAQCGRWSSA